MNNTVVSDRVLWDTLTDVVKGVGCTDDDVKEVSAVVFVEIDIPGDTEKLNANIATLLNDAHLREHVTVIHF